MAVRPGVFDPTDPSLESAHLSDMGNAQRFVEAWGHELRYVPPHKLFYVFDGQRWAEDTLGLAMERAKRTIQGLWREAEYEENEEDRKRLLTHALRSESVGRLQAMLTLAQSAPGIPILPDALDADPWLLNVQNGTLDLRTGTLRPHAADELITRLLPIAYDPAAACPQWRAFMEQIMGDNVPLMTFLQRAVGYALTGLTREQVFFILFGVGANGKSTFLHVVTTLLGDYARQTPIETFMLRSHETISNDLARLAGVRFVAASEAESQRRLAEALVKQVTGGERIAARFLHKEFFEFTPRFKLFLATNHKPVIHGSDHAIWRRVRLIPFTVTIPDEAQDRELARRLIEQELPGILAWAVEGCLAWQRDGLGLPDEVRAAVEGYRTEMDVIGAFLEECCELMPAMSVAVSALYARYAKWCAASNERPMTKRRLSMALKDRGIATDRSSEARRWIGLRLLGEEPDETEKPVPF